jgi:hypothetical protein
MADIEKDLTKKIGPLPVWAYGAILGVGLIAYMWWSSNSAASSATTTAATTETVPDDVSGTGLSAASGDTSTDVGATGTTLLTNALWEAQALADLAGSGVSPLTAQVALENYLNGVALTPAQQSIVNTVLTAIGAPPEGVAGTPILTPPAGTGTTTTTTAKPTVAPVKPTVVGETTTSATATTKTVKGATGYRWEYDNKTENTVGVANLLSGMKKGGSYKVRVAATNSAGVGPYSTETAFKTKA